MKPSPADSLARKIVRRVRKIEFRARGRVSDLLAGGHLSAFRGTGMRFREVRAYVEGDDPRSIDWNVTARLGEPFIKVFEEDRELTAAFVVDLSASSLVGSRGGILRETAAEFCAVLAISCLGSQESLALLTFTDRTQTWLPPMRGPQVLSRVVREIVEPGPVGRGTDLAQACDQLAKRLSRRSVVFLVSDFRDDPARYAPALRRLGVRHDLNLVHLEPAGFDPLPDAGLVTFLDPETGEAFELDTGDRALRRELSRALDQEAEDLLREGRKARAVVARLRTGTDPFETVRALVRTRTILHGGTGS